MSKSPGRGIRSRSHGHIVCLKSMVRLITMLSLTFSATIAEEKLNKLSVDGRTERSWGSLNEG